MNEMKRLLSFVRRAVDDYNMIEDGDRIAVGISGGKDSLTLLSALAEMRRFYPKKYEVVAITVDMGFSRAGLGECDFSEVKELCRRLKVEYRIVPTDIANIIFNTRKEQSHCSLCAKMRRGALHAAAKESGCNKVALGHHYDDAVETFMLNLFFEGRLGCFSPVSYLTRRDVTVIRPLLYARESDVQYFTRRRSLPVVTSPCPEDHATEREKMKTLIKSLEKENKGLSHRIFHAMCDAKLDGFRLAGRYPDAGEPED